MHGPMSSLDTNFGAPKAPSRVKDHERPDTGAPEVRLNLGYVKLANGTTFRPQPTVAYLWVITVSGDLIVGVENAAASPDAFAVGAPVEQGSADLGHPTLAADFRPDGTAVAVPARIGGELFFDSGQWWINNASGRYSKDRAGDPMPLLANVAGLFQQYCGITVGIRKK